MTGRQKKSKNSSRTKNSSKNSTKQPTLLTRELEIEGRKLVLKEEVIGQRSDTINMTSAEFDKLNEQAKSAIISVSDVEPAPFADKKPEELKYQEEWQRAKDAWDAKEAAKQMKQVNLWMPIKKMVKATIDGHEVRIFHTLRGPMIGCILSEDTNRATLYSPCFLDPNIERNRVHFLPIAFAGFKFTVYKQSCMGEAPPEEAIVMAYPGFIKNNSAGDYTFRMRAAYHHLDADYPDDARLTSVEQIPVRAGSEGLIPTSDTRETKIVDTARKVRTMQETMAKSAAEAAQNEESTPQAEPSEAPPAAAEEAAPSDPATSPPA